jgi:hypothetical protein
MAAPQLEDRKAHTAHVNLFQIVSAEQSQTEMGVLRP